MKKNKVENIFVQMAELYYKKKINKRRDGELWIMIDMRLENETEIEFEKLN